MPPSSFTRRRFTQLSALALASTRLPAQAMPKRIGYAAVGLGNISTTFMQACAQSQLSTLTGLVTGHPEDKGKKFAAQYNVPPASIYTYDTFDRIRHNPAIDAVYIGLPNSMHCDFTIRAAEAGKHVLCEKPMAISSAECRRMIDACKRANVKLMIAYRIHYDPTFARARDLIRSGAIGQVQAFEGAFPGYQRPGAWRLNRRLAGGGSLFDLGIYPLNTIRFLCGEEPIAFTAMTATRETSTGRFAEVEQSVVWTMKFPSGILADCSSSYGQSGENFVRVRGDKGFLQISPAYGYEGMRLTGSTQGRIDEPSIGKLPFQFVLEADHLARCIHSNTTPTTPGEEGLRDLLYIEAIYKAAGAPLA